MSSTNNPIISSNSNVTYNQSFSNDSSNTADVENQGIPSSSKNPNPSLIQTISRFLFANKENSPAYIIRSKEELFQNLERLGFTGSNLGDDLSLVGRSMTVAYYNYVIDDAFGSITGDSGWAAVKRHYTFKYYGYSLFWVQVLQVTICLFTVFSNYDGFYDIFAVAIAGLYIIAKIAQGGKIVYNCTFNSEPRVKARFTRLFPFIKYICGFNTMNRLYCFAVGCGCSVGDAIPSMTYHGMFDSGSSVLIAYCGLAYGITSTSAFAAVSAFVAFRFVGEFDDVFVNRMTTEATISDLIEDIKPQDSTCNCIVFLIGSMYVALLGLLLVTYPIVVLFIK